MKKTTFALASVAVIALAVASSLTVVKALGHDHDRFHLAWKDVYGDPAAMTRGVDAVVLARHVGTSPGRIAYSDDPQDAVAFELNHFVVERGFKGLAAGQAFTVERVGNGDAVILDADGGPYTPGRSYALFINRQPESGFFYVVNDEGRYAIDRGRLVGVNQSGRVGARLTGMAVDELDATVREALRPPIKN